MCGGGRGERYYRKTATKQISCQFSPELFSSSIQNRLATCILKYLHNDSRVSSKDSSVVNSSLAGDLTAKPLTVSLIFCPILSCRVSGMSLICFFTWHASSSCITHFACTWVPRKILPWMHTAHSCYMLASLLDYCQLRGMSDFKFLEYENQTCTAR